MLLWLLVRDVPRGRENDGTGRVVTRSIVDKSLRVFREILFTKRENTKASGNEAQPPYISELNGIASVLWRYVSKAVA